MEEPTWRLPPPNSPQSFSSSPSQDPPGILCRPSGGLSKVRRQRGSKIEMLLYNYFLRLCRHSPPGTSGSLEVWSNYTSLDWERSITFSGWIFYFLIFRADKYCTFLPFVKCYWTNRVFKRAGSIQLFLHCSRKSSGDVVPISDLSKI